MKEAPVSPGQEIEVEIISMGRKGDGVAKFNNFIIIIPGTSRGDKVKAEITDVMESFAFAICVKKLNP